MKQTRKQSLAFVLSLAFHCAIVAVLALFSDVNFSRRSDPKRTEVELMDPEQLLQALKKQDLPDKGQIVDQSEQALNNEKPKDAKFLSRHDQVVQKQTQSDRLGRFHNGDGAKGPQVKPAQAKAEKPVVKTPDLAKANESSAEKKPIEEKEKETLTSADGVDIGKKRTVKDLIPSFKPVAPPLDPSQNAAVAGGNGPSTNDDRIRDVNKGMQTLLSTREFVYFSYYNRIKDKLRQYWEPKIKEKMEHILRQGRTIASNTDRITRIVIVLDQSGTLVGVQVIGPSGVTDLDEAAVEAFRAAAPFPNPPKGIVDSDGTIRIRWDFILEANADGFLNAVRMASQQL